MLSRDWFKVESIKKKKIGRDRPLVHTRPAIRTGLSGPMFWDCKIILIETIHVPQ